MFSDPQILLNQLLEKAETVFASDIHINPTKEHYQIFFRIQGLLSHQQKLPKSDTLRLFNHIKILSHCDITEKRIPQSGQFKNNKKMSCRISTCPTQYGERLVIRVFNNRLKHATLETLGLSVAQIKLLRHTLQSQKGLCLVTGPTGSGKTVTLYSLLKEFHPQKYNIMTIEDPIEQSLSFVQQSEVQKQLNFTYETAIPHFLRQDPDIIMLGEIRDKQTCTQAVTAALTGHLVFSSCHASNTLDTIMRLIDFDISKIKISIALNCIISQRLINVLCCYCKKQNTNQTFSAVGCSHCQMGYSHRRALFEILPFTSDFKKMLYHDENFHFSQTISSLAEQANDLLKRGETSMEEIQRIGISNEI